MVTTKRTPGERPSGTLRLAACLAMLATGCQSTPVCEAEALRAQLESARSGDQVRVGACRIEGTFHVPAGVTLSGEGPELSVIAAADELTNALDVDPGTESQPTVIEGLTLEHDGGFGIRSAESGHLVVRNVEICSRRGVGLGLQFLEEVVLEDLVVEGPVTVANAAELGDLYDAVQTATFGIALFDVGDAQLRRVQVIGFAEAGLVSSRSTVDWVDGLADVNLGVGVRLDHGAATMTNVSVLNTLRGFRGVPSYGLFTSESDVTTTDLMVADSRQGFGVMHIGGDVAHTNLRVNDNGSTGLMAQFMDSFLIEGPASEVLRNQFAGVLVVDSPGAVLRDFRVEDTTMALGLPMGFDTVTMGDGVQLVRSGGSELRGIRARNNERVAVLVDLDGGSTMGLIVSGVSAEAAGTALGVVAQNGTVVAGWDADVTRLGAALANDTAFSGGLDVADVVGSSDFPAIGPLMRAEMEGIDGIVAPCD